MRKGCELPPQLCTFPLLGGWGSFPLLRWVTNSINPNWVSFLLLSRSCSLPGNSQHRACSCCRSGLFRAFPLGTALLPVFCWKCNSHLSCLPLGCKPSKDRFMKKKHHKYLINTYLESSPYFLRFQKHQDNKNYQWHFTEKKFHMKYSGV